MKFQRRCRIGCFQFALNFGPQPDGDLGRVSVDHLRIGIDNALLPAVQAETIVHEALHAMIDISGLREIRAVQKNEEQIVRALSPLLFGFIADNPALIRDIQKAARA